MQFGKTSSQAEGTKWKFVHYGRKKMFPAEGIKWKFVLVYTILL
jgi:hypothetical protein